jgi:hypothetical protein
LNGVSLYAPSVESRRNFRLVWHLYNRFAFAQTHWNGLVHVLAGA